MDGKTDLATSNYPFRELWTSTARKNQKVPSSTSFFTHRETQN